MKQTKLTTEELKQAKKLARRLKTQNNRGTALPIWFLLQDIEERFDHPENDGEFLAYRDSCGEIFRGKSRESILKQVKKSYDWNLRNVDDKQSYNEEKELIEDNCFPMVEEYVTKQIFMTLKAAKEHWDRNKHHYSKKARIYVDHAWRSPEMELVYKILTSF